MPTKAHRAPETTRERSHHRALRSFSPGSPRADTIRDVCLPVSLRPLVLAPPKEPTMVRVALPPRVAPSDPPRGLSVSAGVPRVPPAFCSTSPLSSFCATCPVSIGHYSTLLLRRLFSMPLSDVIRQILTAAKPRGPPFLSSSSKNLQTKVHQQPPSF